MSFVKILRILSEIHSNFVQYTPPKLEDLRAKGLIEFLKAIEGMKVTNYLNTTKEKVDLKDYNPWIGISLGNKYFTPERLKDYIESCLLIAKKQVLVIVADDLQAINYAVFEGKSHEVALAKARRKGEVVFCILTEIVNQLPEHDRTNVRIVRWQELTETTWYQERLKIYREMFQSEDFKDKLIQIVQMNMGDRLDKISDSEVEKLTTYVLEELPIFMGALNFEGYDYDLHLYPGLSLLDNFIIDLQKGKTFPEILRRISVTRELAIIEAYAD